MCPAFGSLRVGLRMRAHRHGAVRLRLLRLRPHLYLALLRRPSHRRLRAFRFRDPGHRQAVRGSARGHLQARRSEAVRRTGDHQSVRADRFRCAPRSAAERNQRCAHHRNRCAGLRCADSRRSQGHPRRRDAALCALRGGARAGSAPQWPERYAPRWPWSARFSRSTP
jgi:hypothetical protein